MKAALQSRRCVVSVRQLPHAEGLPLPAYQTAASAGLDLNLAAPAGAPLVLVPGASALAPTGLEMALPPGYEAQIRPRSGLAAKHGVTVLNSPGTIDSDYRGEIRVLLVNFGRAAVVLARGDRIAQLIIAPVSRATLVEVERLPSTRRGAGGFGSTGRGPEMPLVGKKRKSVAKKKAVMKARTQKRTTRAKG